MNDKTVRGMRYMHKRKPGSSDITAVGLPFPLVTHAFRNCVKNL